MAPSLTGIDNLRLLWHLAVPMQLGGIVAPSRRLWPGLVRRQVPIATSKFLHGIRKKYGPRVRCWFPFNSTLLVLDGKGIEQALASELNFADPAVKRWTLTRFTPFGVIVSREPEWQVRRGFNEHVLATDSAPHPNSSTFLSIIEDEIARLLAPGRKVLAWDDFSELAARISQQIIFGRGHFRSDFNLHLSRLVSASNWYIRHPCHFVRFNKRIEEGLAAQSEPSLARASREAPTPCAEANTLQPGSQAAFWCFVLKDAIELHTIRTLALIAGACPGLRKRLMAEVSAVPKNDWAGFTSVAMPLLESCIREQLRLWTPVPLLPRRVVKNFEFDGTPVREGQQILLYPGFYHRDPEVFGPDADRFSPERLHPPLYSFSAHRQACAAQPLVIFVLKAVLTALLKQGTFEMLDQRIDTNAVPIAIDHFALRFWWRQNKRGAKPARSAS